MGVIRAGADSADGGAAGSADASEGGNAAGSGGWGGGIALVSTGGSGMAVIRWTSLTQNLGGDPFDLAGLSVLWVH